MFSCEDDGPNKCDTALMKLPADQVPKNARLAALKVYQWSDEVGLYFQVFVHFVNITPQFPKTRCAFARMHSHVCTFHNCVKPLP